MIELLTTTEMTQADRLAIAGGVAGIELMERAGGAVAAAVAARHAVGDQVVVLAGPGNNGGDGFIAARLLAQRGFRVRLMLAGDVARLKGDAAAAAKKWAGPIDLAAVSGFGGADVIIDALFGAGLDRPVEEPARSLIEGMNAQPAPVVAVDLPSGINGTSGATMGSAVNATQTVTFFRKKPGHLLLPGRLYCGPISVADIGIPKSVLDQIGAKTFENTGELWHRQFPIRSRQATNTTADTSWSPRVPHGLRGRPVLRHAGRYARARDW